MRKLLIFTFLAATSLTVAAQNRDTQQQPQPQPQTQDQQPPSDAQKARTRVDGAAGGTAPVPEDARKGVGAGARPHKRDDLLDRGLHRRLPDETIEPPK